MSEASAIGVSDEVLRSSIDACLLALIDRRGFPARLAEAMRYAALGPGKRVRPILCLRACLAVDERMVTASAHTAAAAVELVHAFSLVHDDLPAMDDDDLRRGRPTLHKAFDEATAILAGDALQGLAMESLAALENSWAASAVHELAKATNDMIAGQVYDTLNGVDDAGSMSDAQRLERVHRLKTGALLRAAGRIGGLAGEAEESQLAALSEFADGLGLMFQALDDLLDVTSDAATLGKATQKDAEAGKLTYPLVFGIDGTRREITRLQEQSTAALAVFGASADPLREMADRLACRTR